MFWRSPAKLQTSDGIQLKIRVMAKSPSNLKDLGLNTKYKRTVERYKQLVYIIRRF